MLNTEEFSKLYEDETFRYWLYHTLRYAAASHNVQHGAGASDVLIFMGRYGEQIFDEKTHDEIAGMREDIRTMRERQTLELQQQWVRELNSQLAIQLHRIKHPKEDA